MPCQSRIDAFGALHHIIAGGIKRKRIFTDDADGNNLTEVEKGVMEKGVKSAFDPCSTEIKIFMEV